MVPVIPGLSELVAIGRGGSALVYSATRNAVGDRVAVKVLNDALADPAAQRHFERELESLRRLADVPGVVAILDSGVTDNGDPYLVMPLFEGGSAHSLIEDDTPISWTEAAHLVIAASDAVHAAHERGVWHRDIKPGNILLTSTGRPFVADFGIAKLLADAVTTYGPSSLTPRFAAPEVLSGTHVAQSDVYSLAATYVAFVTGQPPFADTSHSVVDIINQVLQSDPPNVADVGVPQPVADLIMRAMSKDPVDRPATPGEFADLLRSHVAHATAVPAPVASGAAGRATQFAPPAEVEPPLAPPTRAPSPPSSQPATPEDPESPTRRLGMVFAFVSMALLIFASGWLFGLFGDSSTNETAATAIPTAAIRVEPTTPPLDGASASTEPTTSVASAAQPTPAEVASTTASVDTNSTISVQADGSGDVATLLEALQSVQEGDTVQLGPGTYPIEKLAKIATPITISGAGPDTTTITVTGDTTALDIRGPNITISDLTVTSSYVLEEDEEAFALIQLVTATDFTLHNVVVTGGSSYGLASFGFTTGMIASSSFTDNIFGGLILLQQSDLALVDNRAAGNQQSGFTWFEQATGLAVGNVAIDNGVSGFVVEDQAEPRLVDNTADRNGQDGFTWLDQAAGTATGNVATNNFFDGFAAEQLAEPTWTSNRASGNQRNDFYEADGSGTTNDAGLVLSVQADGSGDVATLALALGQATAGTIVRLGPGVHSVDEQLIIPASVVVAGEGSGRTTILSSATMPVLALSTGSTVSNLGVASTASVSSRSRNAAMVEVRDAVQFALYGVEVNGRSERAVEVTGESTGLIVDSQLSSNSDTALVIGEDATVSVTNTST